jgi:CRISPR-associated endonuclease Csy4
MNEMTFYQELTLLPDELSQECDDVGIHFLWSKIYTQLHLALVEMKDEHGQTPIGVSFVNYQGQGKQSLLGNKLRVFAPSSVELEQLNPTKWLTRFTDYVHLTSIKNVPDEHSHLVVSRVQTPASQSNKARRYAKRHDMSLEAAEKLYEGYQPKSKNLAFIQLKSLSSAHDFVLCIQQSPAQFNQVGTFSTYGLSSTSTVPHW